MEPFFKTRISIETGVPVQFLTGKTAAECQQQAEEIERLVHDPPPPVSYPQLHDNGEVDADFSNGNAAEEFSNWVNLSLAWDPRRDSDGWTRLC